MLGWRSHNTKDEHYLDVARACCTAPPARKSSIRPCTNDWPKASDIRRGNPGQLALVAFETSKLPLE